MKFDKLAIADFETEGIDDRPEYPPKPVGLAIKLPGQLPEYHAWGHRNAGAGLEKNGSWQLKGKKLVRLKIDNPRYRAEKLLVQAHKNAHGVLGHNYAKFDLDVAEKHMGVAPPPWQSVHDSLFTRFLVDPHAATLSLKPSAEKVLGEAPDERDAVFDWLAAKGIIQKPRIKAGKLTYTKDAGRYICEAPGELVAPYAIGDLTRSLGLFEHDYEKVSDLEMLSAYDRERELAPLLLANEREGIRLDMAGLAKYVPLYEAALEKVHKWLRKRLNAPIDLNWDADAEVAVVLKKSGVVKEFPKTEKGNDSLSKKNLTAAFYSDKDVYRALCWRNMTEYVMSQSLRPWLASAAGRIYTVWNQVRGDSKGGARSGRITCSKLQNLIKSATGGKDPDYMSEADEAIRKKIGLPPVPMARLFVLPDEGHLFGHVDYNQQELRLLAHYEDGALAYAYRTDPSTDVHAAVKTMILEATAKNYDREPVKTVNFRTVYGGGATGLAIALRMPLKDAKQLISDWKKALPDVVALDRMLKDIFKAGDFIRTFGGRVYHVKPPAIAKKGARKGQMISFEYTALNYLIQPSGADVTKEAILRWHKHPKREARMLCTVHDEINISAKKKIAKQQVKILQECMESVKLDVPWKTDGDVREAWGLKGEKV